MINCEAFLCLENEFESRTLELSHPGANGGISKSYFTLYSQPYPSNIKVTGAGKVYNYFGVGTTTLKDKSLLEKKYQKYSARDSTA